jgi:4,5-DOPA dioxygenase extradiol
MNRLPTLFVSHGAPTWALEPGVAGALLSRVGETLPRPEAALVVSPHWTTRDVVVSSAQAPRTIHDFGGFPEALYRVEYPAPGDPALATRVAGLLAGNGATTTTRWGLDHGTWTVLLHLRPAADVPVVQLSIDAGLSPAQHLAVGRALRPLRDEGVLVLASGNVVHNLPEAFGAWRRGDATTPAWARRFDEAVADAFARHDGDALVRAIATDDGRRSHPTPDHFLPLLYAAGAGDASDPVAFPIEGFDMGSLSMRSVALGRLAAAR